MPLPPDPGATPAKPAVPPRLPAAGEAGGSDSTGAEEVADLPPPPGPRTEKASLSPDVAPPVALAAEAGSAAPATAVARAELPGRVELAAHGGDRDPLPRLEPPAALAAVSPPDLRVLDTLLGPLPEASPRLEIRRDLRSVRSEPVRQVLLRETGGTDRSEAAVALALRWLARHQAPEGYWDVDGFDKRCGECRSPGFLIHCDVAVTGLALLCFLGQNHTPVNPESPYRRAVRAAIDWLVEGQDATGCFARGDLRYTMYTHGIATLALSEAYTLTGEKRLL